MNDREALHWRKNYIEMTVRQNDGTYQWPTKEVFLKAFKAAFLNEDKKEESIRKLNNIYQGNKTAEEYVNEFRLTVSKAGLPTDNDMMIRTFRKGLNKALATRILYSDKKPDALEDKVVGTGANATTKKGWYSIVIEFDRIHRDNVLALTMDHRTIKTSIIEIFIIMPLLNKTTTEHLFYATTISSEMYTIRSRNQDHEKSTR